MLFLKEKGIINQFLLPNPGLLRFSYFPSSRFSIILRAFLLLSILLSKQIRQNCLESWEIKEITMSLTFPSRSASTDKSVA